MKVSVIVPAFNYGRFLPDVFRCLIEQTHGDWECLIIDNGSTDQTGKITLEMARTDSRFKYQMIPKRNPSGARNEGLRHASGDFIQFLDADDVMSRDKFETQLKIFSANNSVDVVFGDYSTSDENLENILPGRMIRKFSKTPFNDFVWYWEKELTIPIHSYLFRKKCFTNWGMMDESIATHEDWDLQLNFSLHNCRYEYHAHEVAIYRIHQQSSSRVNRTQNRFDTLFVLWKYTGDRRVRTAQYLLLVTRYAEFVSEILIDKVRFGNVDVFRAIAMKDRLFLNLISFLVFPFYLIVKIIRKIFS